MMKQGTISVLVGCHSPVHSILVLLSWRKLYGTWPKLWQIVCIFLHDIGHWGLDYLDDPEQKARHWKSGALLASRLFGWPGYKLIAGHCVDSWHSKHYGFSELYRPDKYAWYIAPTWWLVWNNIVEPTLMGKMGMRESIIDFRQKVRQSIESGEFRPTHDMYLERCKGKS